MLIMKNIRIKLFLFIMILTLALSGCNSEQDEEFAYKNNYKVIKNSNYTEIISNKNFKNATFIISPIVYNDEIDEVNVDRKVKIKNNAKTNISKIDVISSSENIKAGEVILRIETNNDYTIQLKGKSFISRFFEKILMYIYKLTKNFGVAIILITLFVKLAMLPLTLKMDKSMRDMKKIQPEVDALKKKYKDNPTKLNEETMKLWKMHNVNPVSGCLPALLQIPIFFALYSILKTDSLANIIPADSKFLYLRLTEADPFYILPILNAVVLMLQQKVIKTEDTNPQTKMLQYFLPIMILMISFKMPSGVQIYWVFSTLFSFLQQYYIVKISNKD